MSRIFMLYSCCLPLEVAEKTIGLVTVWPFIGNWMIFLLIFFLSVVDWFINKCEAVLKNSIQVKQLK